MMKPSDDTGNLKVDTGDSTSKKSVPILTNMAYQWVEISGQ